MKILYSSKIYYSPIFQDNRQGHYFIWPLYFDTCCRLADRRKWSL